MLFTIMIIVLILALIRVLPGAPWTSDLSWGYGPSGILGIVVVILIVLLLMGRL